LGSRALFWKTTKGSKTLMTAVSNRSTTEELAGKSVISLRDKKKKCWGKRRHQERQ